MKKVTMKTVEKSKMDKMIDKKKGLKEWSLADMKMDKKELTAMKKKKPIVKNGKLM